MDGLEPIFRWMHILAGVLWIGLLFFFNWVNSAFVPTLDAETKKKVLPELLPRTLYWFRWGAAWTWITGVVLLMLVFYTGGEFIEGQDKTFHLADEEFFKSLEPGCVFVNASRGGVVNTGALKAAIRSS